MKNVGRAGSAVKPSSPFSPIRSLEPSLTPAPPEVRAILRGVPDFPSSLLSIRCPPARLYIQGDLDAQVPYVAVVGTRRPTAWGLKQVQTLTQELATRGFGIISGLALGIDACAHEVALACGALTVAVLPCGLDSVYPSCHRALAQRILRSGGALVSEYPPDARPERHTFVRRNRLISGLSVGVLFVQGKARSGSMHTARFACVQRRPLFAPYPGDIESRDVRYGGNRVLREGGEVRLSHRDFGAFVDALGSRRGGRGQQLELFG